MSRQEPQPPTTTDSHWHLGSVCCSFPSCLQIGRPTSCPFVCRRRLLRTLLGASATRCAQTPLRRPEISASSSLAPRIQVQGWRARARSLARSNSSSDLLAAASRCSRRPLDIEGDQKWVWWSNEKKRSCSSARKTCQLVCRRIHLDHLAIQSTSSSSSKHEVD